MLVLCAFLATCVLALETPDLRVQTIVSGSAPTAPGRTHPYFPAPPPPDIDHGQQPAYFAVCSVVKDQNADIREWVHYYHWLVGFDFPALGYIACQATPISR
jgi:hypothetical protein